MSSIGDDTDVEVQTRDAASGSEYEDEDDAKRQEADDSGDTESEREGRFHGPDSSWRFYTKEDRAIATSLDQAENNDLSAHLYNAHAWKRALRDVERMREALPWHSKNRWIKPDDTGRLSFLPPASWTAWPLRPEDVPRSQEQWGIPATDPADEADTFANRDPWRPGLHLHNELKAAFLCRAKDGFREREQAFAVQKQKLAKGTLSKTRFSTRSKSSHSDGEYNEDSDESNEDQLRQENLKEDENDTEMAAESVSGFRARSEEHVPYFLLDDERAGSILEPTIQHITAKFDDLLIGLHKSQLGHRQDRSRSRGSSTGPRLRSKSRERPRSVASVPAKRKRVVSGLKDEEVAPASESPEFETEVRAGMDPQHGSRRRMPAPRDWSEVLGIAAIVGWDQEILDRAARRCAAMFGETMTIRMMPETSFGNARDQVVEYVPDMVPPIDESSWEGMEPEKDSEEEPQGQPNLACPDKTCRRQSEPYASAWRLREHLKRKHLFTEQQINRLVPRPSTPASRTTITKTDRYPAGEEEDAASSEDVVIGNDQDVAAVRLDGFLQPIDIRLHRSKDKQPRKRSTSRPRADYTSAE